MVQQVSGKGWNSLMRYRYRMGKFKKTQRNSTPLYIKSFPT
jgi:hypothetical protein